jgi:hypothetical protein
MEGAHLAYDGMLALKKRKREREKKTRCNWSVREGPSQFALYPSSGISRKTNKVKEVMHPSATLRVFFFLPSLLGGKTIQVGSAVADPS